jgi:uncharacterized membrane protein
MYQTLLLLHFLSAFMLVGGATVGNITTAMARRTTGTKELATIAAMARRVPMMTGPGSLLAMITGSLLVWKMGFGFGTPWVIAAYVCWAIAVVLSGAVLGRKMGAAAPLLQKAIADNAPEAPDFQQAITDSTMRMTQHALSTLLLIFVVLMTFKPGM